MPKIQRAAGQVEVQTLPSVTGRWCSIDGSWKENEPYSGQGWYSTMEGFDGLMGVRKVREISHPFTHRWKR